MKKENLVCKVREGLIIEIDFNANHISVKDEGLLFNDHLDLIQSILVSETGLTKVEIANFSFSFIKI